MPPSAPSSAPPLNASYTLDYRPDLAVLVMRWLRPHSLPETQASYHHLLRLAQEHGCGHWLLDGRRDGPIVLDAARWLGSDFLPAAARQLAPAPLRLAVFSSPARFEQRLIDIAVAPAVAAALAATQPYHTALFLDGKPGPNLAHHPLALNRPSSRGGRSFSVRARS